MGHSAPPLFLIFKLPVFFIFFRSFLLLLTHHDDGGSYKFPLVNKTLLQSLDDPVILVLLSLPYLHGMVECRIECAGFHTLYFKFLENPAEFFQNKLDTFF